MTEEDDAYFYIRAVNVQRPDDVDPVKSAKVIFSRPVEEEEVSEN